ncbi:MAG: YchF/TatD family DNA exonuclease [Ignavibacteriaceae bacterium]|nr:YchF/TatD family DNA exonuclease [Ignavibacteriaceae bacterium]
MKLTDSHAHLYSQEFRDDFDAVLDRARQAGVHRVIIPATDITTAKEVLALCDKYDMIYGAVGVHPHDAAKAPADYLPQIRSFAAHPKIVAIGEIGLDYFYDFSPKEVQDKIFREQLNLSLELGKPVIIHNRDSTEDMMNIIRSYSGTGLKAQFHCFNAGLEKARELVRLHHYISFTGNITFKKMDDLRVIAAGVSPEHLLLETDSPYMTPVPFRGKRNEPMHTRLVAEKLAELHHLTPEDIGRITEYNVFRFFGLGSVPEVSFTYKIGNALYINVTNRCNADCVFCARETEPVISGYNLAMKKSEEPPAEQYIKQIGDPKQYSEIVFCGYGEPTIRWDVIKAVAGYVKSSGGKTRMNTNGHGSFINKRDITPEMQGLIDTVSVSLNSYNPEKYAELMKVNQKLFGEMLSFITKAQDYVPEVVVSVVSGMENEAESKKFSESLGRVKFRVREFF